MENKFENLKRNFKDLALLGSCKPGLRKTILKGADNDLIFTLCEIVLNTLNGSIQLNNKEFNKLKNHKTCFRKLIDNKNSIKKKKYILIQNGGSWMPFLIPPVIEAVKSILNL